jgi:type I restriction enzyme S subunit
MMPSHWHEFRSKRLFSNNKEKNTGNTESNVLSLTLKGVIRNDKERPIGLSPNDYSTYQIFEKDDLVFKLIDLENISTSRVGIVPERGIMSSAYIRLTARKELNIRYFYMQYYAMWLRNIFNGLGAGVRQTLTANDLLNIGVVVPPIEEQNQIVNFLDWKVSSVNSLINIRKAQIRSLEEIREKKVDEIVLKGIKESDYKHSGVDWFDDIPKNWQTRRIKFLFDLRDERNHLPLNEVNLISLYTKFGVVQNCDVEYTTGNRATTAEGYKKVYKDDIVVNIILCWMGAVGRCAYNGVTSPAYDIYKPREDVCSRYYHYLFRTKRFSGQCYRAGKGIMAMRWRTYSPQFRNIIVPLPPYDEQIAIADYLDNLLKDTDNEIAVLREDISRLEELKTTLISDVVVGKIDVRDIEIPEYEVVDEDVDSDFDGDEDSDEDEEQED